MTAVNAARKLLGMHNPLLRMRRERRLALLFFNLFLLVALCVQWAVWRQNDGQEVAISAPAVVTESQE